MRSFINTRDRKSLEGTRLELVSNELIVLNIFFESLSASLFWTDTLSKQLNNKIFTQILHQDRLLNSNYLPSSLYRF